MPQSSNRRHRAWPILAALVLLTLVPFAIHRAITTDGTYSQSASEHRDPTQSSTSRGTSSGRSQRSVARDLPPTHTTEDLKTFHLPTTELTNVSLEEALDILLSQYRQICRENREGPIRFEYSVEGNPDPIVYLKLGGDLLSNIKYIASMAGTTLTVQNGHLTFTEVEEGRETQRRWTVPPTFSAFLPHLNEQGQRVDPGKAPFGYDRPKVPELLKSLGVIKEGDLISFLTSSSTLILRTNEKNHVKTDGLVLRTISDIPYQTLIKFQDPTTPNLGMIIHPGELGLLQKSGPADGSSPDLQFLVSSSERGFGREITAVSFTGNLPSNEAQALFLETGNVADLGVRENLSSATFNITRESRKEPLIFTFKDKHGIEHQMPFTSQRIDAVGRPITIPELASK